MNIQILEKKETPTGWQFKVQLKERNDPLEFSVQLDNNYYLKLTGSTTTPEELVKKSFQFLLERESKHSILASFNLRDIQTYFPEYEDQISA